MRSWLRRWKDPYRLIAGLLFIGAVTWLCLGVFGVVHLKLTWAIAILLLGLLAYEATI